MKDLKKMQKEYMVSIKDNGYYDWHNNVLNGIAYNKERGTFFVTGKRWDLIFEVTLEENDY